MELTGPPFDNPHHKRRLLRYINITGLGIKVDVLVKRINVLLNQI